MDSHEEKVFRAVREVSGLAGRRCCFCTTAFPSFHRGHKVIRCFCKLSPHLLLRFSTQRVYKQTRLVPAQSETESEALLASCLFLQTQEREAKAEMRRKAKELQQARRDAERQGKKAPGFGGFGSSAMAGSTAATMITETIVETEKPKVAPAPARWVCWEHMGCVVGILGLRR